VIYRIKPFFFVCTGETSGEKKYISARLEHWPELLFDYSRHFKNIPDPKRSCLYSHLNSDAPSMPQTAIQSVP
jgi:hypothetical protein